MDFNQIVAKLGRNGLVIAAGGLLAFIVSFFPWYGVSGATAEMKAFGIDASVNAWDAGFAAWFSMLLLLALGVLAVLVVLDVVKVAPLMLGFLEFAGAVLAAVLVLLRWLTYKTASEGGISVGAMWGTYIGVVIAIAVAVFAYFDYSARGGDLKDIGAAFRQSELPPPSQY